MRFDLARMRQRAADIRYATGFLERYAALPPDAFTTDPERVSTARYQAIVAVEAALDICNHLAAKAARRVPSSYAECFQILGQAMIIPGELASRLAAAAKFRNLLVHQYGLVDDARVHEEIGPLSRDLDAYLRAVATYVREEL